MAEVKWIKIATDIFNNKKIRLIESMPDGDSIIVIWFKLLMLAGNVNDGGAVYFTKDIPYTEQMLSTVFNRPLTTVQLALSTFEKFQMIEIVNEIIQVSNWEKYQNVDRLEEIREYNRLAKQKSRAKQKLLTQNVNDMSMTSQRCHDTDIDIEVDKEKNKRLGRTKFTPPTLEEVQAYCKERGNKVDAKAFFDYFTTGGWKDSKGNPVKNWKQKIITWEKFETQPKPKKENSFNQMIKTNYDFDAIEKEILQ